MKALALLTSAVALAACDARPSAHAAAESPGPSPTGHTVAPVTAKWIVTADQGGQLQLVAHIELTTPTPIPLTVSVSVPAGLTLVTGVPRTTIASGTPAGPVEVDYAFTYTSAPPDDLVLAVDGASAAYGVHARDAYRFGRPAPGVAAPQASGPALQWKGANLGNSIPLGPPTHPVEPGDGSSSGSTTKP